MNVAINSNLNALEPTTGTEFSKTVTAGSPATITAANTYFRFAILMAKSASQTLNTDKVWWGPRSGAGNQSYKMSPGDVVFLSMPVGCRGNFAELYLDSAVNAEGLTIIYW